MICGLMNAAAILFPFGVRLSTEITCDVFLALAIRRRDWKPLLAAWTWLWGFEAAYDASVLAFRHPTAGERPLPAFYLILGVATVVWMTFRIRVRPALWPLVGAAAVWIVWASIGFPVNTHDATAIHPFAEVLNEAAKSLWALAYLIPLLHGRRLEQASPGIASDAPA